jgi:hypothetical protein
MFSSVSNAEQPLAALLGREPLLLRVQPPLEFRQPAEPQLRGVGAAGWGSTSQAGSTGNQQGFSVSISGNIAVSSVPGANNNTGLAFVFEHSGGQWNKKWALPDPRDAEGDYYSWSPAISSTPAAPPLMNLKRPWGPT